MTTSEVLSTPIKAAERLSVPAPYVYQMIRDKKVPEEHIVMQQSGDKLRPMLKQSFFDWYAKRPTRARGASSDKMDKLLIAMAERLESTGNKSFAGLTEALRATVKPAPAAVPEAK